jgi:hypothetical protein
MKQAFPGMLIAVMVMSIALANATLCCSDSHASRNYRAGQRLGNPPVRLMANWRSYMLLRRVCLVVLVFLSPLFAVGQSRRLDKKQVGERVVGESSTGTRPDFLGAYRFPDGRIIAIRQSSEEGTCRYTDFNTGESHKLYPDDSSHFHSAADWASATPVGIRYQFQLDNNNRALTVIVRIATRPSVEARRLELREETATFRSGEIQLFGKLVLPASGRGPFRWLSSCTARTTPPP